MLHKFTRSSATRAEQPAGTKPAGISKQRLSVSLKFRLLFISQVLQPAFGSQAFQPLKSDPSNPSTDIFFFTHSQNYSAPCVNIYIKNSAVAKPYSGLLLQGKRIKYNGLCWLINDHQGEWVGCVQTNVFQFFVYLFLNLSLSPQDLCPLHVSKAGLNFSLEIQEILKKIQTI